MAHPKSMTPLTPHRVVSTAKRRLWMPGANPLTRELTAAILRSYGVLEAPATAAELRIITEALREQHALMQQTAQTLADTSRFLVEALAEHKAAMAGITRLLIQTADCLERQG